MSTPSFIHPQTEALIDAVSRDMPQSLIIAGPTGVGLSGVAMRLAKNVGAKPMIVLPEKDEKIDLEKGVITVDIIRRLYELTKTIESGVRMIVIDYAERMGVQAQNAFLKLLEEPTEHTHFVLLTHQVSRLLPTIQSRTQQLDVLPITTEQSKSLLATLSVSDPQKVAQLLFIAAGLPAYLTSLATDKKLFADRAQTIRDARSFLQGTMYERLKVAAQLKDDRQKALTLLLDAMKLVQGSLKSGQSPEQVTKIASLLATYERIEANGNIRLQLGSSALA